jgi:hypothetical protein
MFLPWALLIGGNVVFGTLAGVLEIGALAGVGGLCSLAGFVLFLLGVMKATNDLNAVTGNTGFAWWPIFIPFYNYYWMWIMVPAEVARAKQMRGVQTPPRGFIMYFFPFLFLFAFGSDLNDIAQAP